MSSSQPDRPGHAAQLQGSGVRGCDPCGCLLQVADPPLGISFVVSLQIQQCCQRGSTATQQYLYQMSSVWGLLPVLAILRWPHVSEDQA